MWCEIHEKNLYMNTKSYKFILFFQLALYHCKLDELMADENLVKMLQNKANAKPKRVPMGENCIVCGVSFPQREHVCRHFMDELLNITNSFTSPLSCAFCPFTADRAEYVAR